MVEDIDREDEVNPNDPEARKIREDAVAYADRVAAGEEPWKDGEAGDGNDVPEPVDGDVGESGEPGNEVVEIDAVPDTLPEGEDNA